MTALTHQSTPSLLHTADTTTSATNSQYVKFRTGGRQSHPSYETNVTNPAPLFFCTRHGNWLRQFQHAMYSKIWHQHHNKNISSHSIHSWDLPYPKVHTLPINKSTTYPQSTTPSIHIPHTDVHRTVQLEPYGCYYTTDEPIKAKQLMPLFGQWQHPLLKYST